MKSLRNTSTIRPVAALEVSSEFPDISGSLEAVKDVIDLKHAEREG